MALQPILKCEISFWSIKPHHDSQLSSAGGDGPTTLHIYLILMFTKPLWSSKEIIQATDFFQADLRGGLIKHDKERNYFKSKSMNLPKAIDIYLSVDPVMNVVILACRTCLFFHHLLINWIVRGGPGKEEWGGRRRSGSVAICIPGTFWSQVDINLIREAPLAFCLLQTRKQRNCVCASLSNCSTVTRVEN